MTGPSPELVVVEAPSVAARRECDAVEVSQLFFLLAQLNCLDSLSESHNQLKASLENAMRLQLSWVGPVSPWHSALRLWCGFSSFRSELLRQLPAAERDVVSMQFLLKRLSLRQLFDESLTRTQLDALYKQWTAALLESQGGAVEVLGVLQDVYNNQRRVILKESVVALLPTAVLVISSLIALTMATLFLRSLWFGV